MRAITIVAASFIALVGCSDSGDGNVGGGGAAPGTTTGAEGSGGNQGGSGGRGGGGAGGQDSTSTSGSGGHGRGAGGSGGESSTSGSGGAGEGGGAAAFGPCGTAGMSFGPPEAFLDLGHQGRLARVFVSGDRVLSWDYDRWILWDTDTGAAIADGHAPGGLDPGDPLVGEQPFELPGGVALRGDTVLIQTDPQHAFELRSAIDGSLLASVTAAYGEAGLASDGSYAWTRGGPGNTITLFSIAGVERWSVATSHYGHIYAAPDALRIGPAIAPVQHSIAVFPADGSPPTVTPDFAGTFHSWFQDGERFLTTVGTTVRVYSKAVIQESIVNLPSINQLAGTRDYFWTLADSSPGWPIMVYRVGGGAVPAAEYPYGPTHSYAYVPTERALAVFYKGSTKVDIVDLDGSEVTRSEHELPVADIRLAHVDQDLRWAVSNDFGVILQKDSITDPENLGLLGCGALRSVAGSPSGHVALATASGKTLIYDTAALDAGPSAVVPFLGSKVLLSADGSLLAARPAYDSNHWDTSLRLFSLPDGEELASISRGRVVQDFSMSFDGSTVGRTYSIDDRFRERVVSDWSGSTPIFLETGLHTPPPLVSPDGHHFVVTDELPAEGCGFTQFYEDGALVNAVPGCAIGWLDDTRVLVQTYKRPRDSRWIYDASTIYDELGNVVAAPPLPMIPVLTDSSGSRDDSGIQAASATVLYSRYDGALYDIETGAKLATFPAWRSSVAGDFVVYPCGYGVCAETF